MEGLRRHQTPQTPGRGRASVHSRRIKSGVGREAVGGQGHRGGRAGARTTHDKKFINR